MGVAGDVITPAIAARARAGLTRIAATLRNVQPTAQAPRLLPLPAASLERLSTAARKAFVWRDDGWCAGRATFGAALVNRGMSHPSSVSDAMYGAVAVADGPIVVRSSGRPKVWQYHAATAVLPEGASELQVIDFLLFNRPVPLSTWQQTLKVPPGRIQLRHPLDQRMLSIGGGDPAVAITDMHYNLARSFDVAESTGAVQNPLLSLRQFREAFPQVAPTGRAAASRWGNDDYQNMY